MNKRETHASVEEVSQDKANLAYIDLLRGLAIIGVLLVHSTMGLAVAGLNQLPLHTEWLLLAGKHGVALFFVVSAYTLMRSMHNRIDIEHMPLQKYFLRRFFRIAPAYYTVLLIVFFAYGKGFPGYSNPVDATLTWADLGAHLLFINGFFPYYTNDFLAVEWSVATEFLFYAMLPFIFIWLHDTSKKSHAMWKVTGLYLVSIVFLWLMFFKGGHLQHLIGKYPPEIFGPWSYSFILTHLHEFVIGIGVWVMLHIARGDRQTDRQTDRQKLAGVLLIGITLAYVENYWLGSVCVSIMGLVIWGLLSAELIYLLERLRPRPIWGLSFFGKISFSLYLVHFPICYGLSRSHSLWTISAIQEVNFLLFEITALGLSVLVAMLLHHGVERPGMKLGEFVVGIFRQEEQSVMLKESL